MKVHIVLWQDNHIVPRMTQWLVERNGWTVGENPDPKADVNYYMPYLQWNYDNDPGTLSAAWFTHYEDGTEWKEHHWQYAADFVHMPLVTAPMYRISKYGLLNAEVIVPGVDRDIFHPGPRKEYERPVIGTCGVGHPRKGPHLLVDLFYGGVMCDLNIVGIQWPFPHRELAHDAMPDWFRQLDIYLCTSNIEGIPAPVLEALATDIKVVIPDGVGICDQLPEMEGIRHYKKGDGQDMIRAILQALDDKPSDGALRDITEDYTIEDWCESHKFAMEKLLDAAIPV